MDTCTNQSDKSAQTMAEIIDEIPEIFERHQLTRLEAHYLLALLYSTAKSTSLKE